MARSMMFFLYREEPRSQIDNGMGNELTIEVLLVLFLLFGSARNYASLLFCYFFVDYIKFSFQTRNAGRSGSLYALFPLLTRSPDCCKHNGATITDNLMLLCINSELSFPIIRSLPRSAVMFTGNKEFFSLHVRQQPVNNSNIHSDVKRDLK
jgi:hypothetical protein